MGLSGEYRAEAIKWREEANFWHREAQLLMGNPNHGELTTPTHTLAEKSKAHAAIESRKLIRSRLFVITGGMR